MQDVALSIHPVSCGHNLPLYEEYEESISEKSFSTKCLDPTMAMVSKRKAMLAKGKGKDCDATGAFNGRNGLGKGLQMQPAKILLLPNWLTFNLLPLNLTQQRSAALLNFVL